MGVAPGGEGVLGVLQIEMGVEERVVGDVPELVPVAWAVPERFGAPCEGLLEHFKGSQILGNNDIGNIHLDPLSIACGV